jgi:5-methylcytosine-specific restriction endonuclease McrA
MRLVADPVLLIGSHMRRRTRNDGALREAVAQAKSVAGALRLLGLQAVGGNYKTVHRAISELGLDTSHWTGQGHRKGARIPMVPAQPLSKLLVAQSHYKTSKLRLRLLREQVFPHKCCECGLTEWRGGPIPLELDHRDGDHTNNLLENLRLLCPNCHALTDTYRGRNKGRKFRERSRVA